MDVVIINHKECRDGVCALAIARKHEKENHSINIVQVIPMRPGKIEEALQNIIIEKCDEIWCLDIKLSNNDVKLIQDRSNAKIKIFDHHDNNETFDSDILYVYDRTKCGSRLIWEYLYPNEEASELINYIEIRDLHLKAGMDAIYVNEYLFAVLDLVNIDAWVNLLDLKKEMWNNIILTGKILYDRKMDIVNSIMKTGSYRIIDRKLLYNDQNESDEKVHIIIYNSNVYQSEIGSKSLKNRNIDFSVVWKYQNNEIYVSLRSDKDKIRPFNVERIAEIYGGCGHINNASFITTRLDMFGISISI
jgi:oligoribonuclease NrnB/cAMP/cGMP phosphodiesterase (DHH superfamily)